MIDSADILTIKKAFDLYPLQGVTTNPTIIAKEQREFNTIVNDIISVIKPFNASLHVQILGKTAEIIVQEAEFLKKTFVYENLYIKIPADQQGVKAMRLLSAKGFKITATAIITPQQAVISAQAGAEYLAPYINRIEDIGGSSERMVTETIRCLEVGELKNAKILGASFKNVQQVHNTIFAGAKSVTVTPETLDRLLFHPLSEWSIAKFQEDWKDQYGDKNLMEVK